MNGSGCLGATSGTEARGLLQKDLCPRVQCRVKREFVATLRRAGPVLHKDFHRLNRPGESPPERLGDLWIWLVHQRAVCAYGLHGRHAQRCGRMSLRSNYAMLEKIEIARFADLRLNCQQKVRLTAISNQQTARFFSGREE